MNKKIQSAQRDYATESAEVSRSTVLRFKAQEGDLDFQMDHSLDDEKWLTININVPIMDNPPPMFTEDFVHAVHEQGLDHMLERLHDDVLQEINEHIIIRALLKRQRP